MEPRPITAHRIHGGIVLSEFRLAASLGGPHGPHGGAPPESHRRPGSPPLQGKRTAQMPRGGQRAKIRSRRSDARREPLHCRHRCVCAWMLFGFLKECSRDSQSANSDPGSPTDRKRRKNNDQTSVIMTVTSMPRKFTTLYIILINNKYSNRFQCRKVKGLFFFFFLYQKKKAFWSAQIISHV